MESGSGFSHFRSFTDGHFHRDISSGLHRTPTSGSRESGHSGVCLLVPCPAAAAHRPGSLRKSVSLLSCRGLRNEAAGNSFPAEGFLASCSDWWSVCRFRVPAIYGSYPLSRNLSAPESKTSAHSGEMAQESSRRPGSRKIRKEIFLHPGGRPSRRLHVCPDLGRNRIW